MADKPKSLLQRLMERRAAIEGGDATGGQAFDNEGNRANREAARETTTGRKPAPRSSSPQSAPRSQAAAALKRKPGESDSAFRLRQIRAAKAAGEL